MKERTRAYRRFQRKRIIQKKRKKVSDLYGKAVSYDVFPFDGTLDKGKIHCSCEMCQKKVRRDGWKHRDRKQVLRSTEMEHYEIPATFMIKN